MIIAEPLRIGDILRCTTSIIHPNPLISVPQLGHIYTVRGWEDHFEGYGVYLEEITNPQVEQKFLNETIFYEPFFLWWQFEVVRQNPFYGDIRDGARGPDYFSMCLNLSFKDLLRACLPEFGVYAMSYNSRERRKCIDLALHQFRNEFDLSFIMRQRHWYGISYPEIYWIGFGPVKALRLMGKAVVPNHLFEEGYTSIQNSKESSSEIQSLLQRVIDRRAIPITFPKGVKKIILIESGAVCKTDEGTIHYLNLNWDILKPETEIIGWP